MFRIVDEKHVIMGDAKQDNMILFIKFEDDDGEEGQNDESKDQNKVDAGEQKNGQPMIRKLSEGQYMGMASILLDEGYSESFDRCHKAVLCCNGDIEQARNALSKITITENQHY